LLKITFVDKYQEDFVNNLKFYRKQQGISQEKLAELCGFSTSTISCVESFHQNPSLDLILKIANSLNIHPADLFLRDSSQTQDRALYAKYHKLIHNCEYLPEHQKQSVDQLVQSLAEATPSYCKSSK